MPKPVLILGAGINGCAIARELLLRGVEAWLVDVADVASGATSGSSRLIHGGLRYLEYGELDLVKESLAERTRLLRLAPQFVHPIRLWIPTSNRLGGALAAVGRFFDWSWWPQRVPREGRGAWLIDAGLRFYDTYARDPLLPKHTLSSVAAPGCPAFDRNRYRWLFSYYDAQVTYPERLVVAMLQDAAELARAAGLDFRVLTYHEATLQGRTVEIRPLAHHGGNETCTLEPSLIVNATGAWVDETLGRLHVPSQRLMGGTKGSHLFTFNPRLRAALGGQGVYAEARDGRPIFITPLADTVLIGTTDEPFEGPPETALASDREQEYLLDSVNAILPDVRLERGDVDFHYSAVRPLPYVGAASPAAVTRRHWLIEQDVAGIPLISIVGGKLTTMRSLAEAATVAVLVRLGLAPAANSRQRVIPGGEDYPASAETLARRQDEIAGRTGYSTGSVAAAWQLCGTRSESILANSSDRELIPDTTLPYCLARFAIEHEWARSLSDLVERRLMLLYHQRITKAGLSRLADALLDAGLLNDAEAPGAVEREIERLRLRHGKRVE